MRSRALPRALRHLSRAVPGRGAVFFALGPVRAMLSDLNEELVATYRVIRDDVEALIDALGRHRADEAHFYEVRALAPATLSPIEVAARTIS